MQPVAIRGKRLILLNIRCGGEDIDFDIELLKCVEPEHCRIVDLGLGADLPQARKTARFGMTRARTLFPLTPATLLGGVLAGSVVDRVIVGGPAWHELGAPAWVAFSRQADLGTGRIAYPVEAIGSTLLTIGAAVSNHLDRDKMRRAVLPLFLAVTFSIIGLILTVKAAPIMLGLAQPQPSAAVETAFKEFFFWGLYLRGAADVLAFAAQLWALAAVGRWVGTPPPGS